VIGKDHTIYALVEGEVTFKTGRKDRTFIHVLPAPGAASAKKAVAKKPVAKKVVPPVQEARSDEEE